MLVTRLVLATSLWIVSEAWVPSISTPRLNTHRFSAADQEMAHKTEKELRHELEDRNSEIQNEEQYAVADGAYLEKLDNAESVASVVQEATEAEASDSSSSLATMMERMTQPRAYPLFLAEKAAEFAEATLDDLFGSGGGDSPTNGIKERVVVLGTGWGGISFLKEINTDLYDVTVISPRNHFVFTPMLAGASVGTVEFRSICEPIREINRNAQYLEATATSIDPSKKTIECQAVVCEGTTCDIEGFTVEYDRLIMTVGAQTNTFGIPGVRECCRFLKNVEDARHIRTSIINCFERANLPNLSDQERENNLTFAIIGAGPTLSLLRAENVLLSPIIL